MTQTKQTVKAIIPGADFVFMSRFASKEQTRYYQGVAVEAGPVLCATDGHRLGAMRLTPEQSYFSGENFILSADKNLLRACKAAACEQTIIICHEHSVSVVTLSAGVSWKAASMLDYTGDAVTFAAKSLYIDGTFPAWRRAVPSTVAPAVGIDRTTSFVAAYLTTFASLSGPIVTISSSGPDAPMLVTNSDPRFIGVLMPMRGDTIDTIMQRVTAVKGDGTKQSDAA